MAQYLYENAVKQLQESGSISLDDFKNLPYEDLTELLEEIKVWCLYAKEKEKEKGLVFFWGLGDAVPCTPNRLYKTITTRGL
jgi:hypothetical protein